MKDGIIKNLEQNVILFESKQTNPLDIEYNKSYKKTFESIKEKEIDEVKNCDNIEKHVFYKIKTMPITINKLTKERSEIDVSKNHLKSAELTANIDVLNSVHTVFMDYSSEIAASKH